MPRSRLRSRKLRHRGGRVAMPIEYYGGRSGRYSLNRLAGVEDTAYGKTIPQSFGMPIPGANAVGPNMGIYPGGSVIQTGGAKKKRNTKKRKSISNRVRRASKRVTKATKRLYKKVKNSTTRGLKRVSKATRSVARSISKRLRRKKKGKK